MLSHRAILPAVAALFSIATAAHAAPVLVNGSFEGPAFAANSLNEITATGVPGWTGNNIANQTHEYVINGNIEDTSGRPIGTTPFGDQYLGLNAIRNNSFRSIISQVVTGFDIGQAYALTVWIANLDGATDPRMRVTATDGTDGSGTTLNTQIFTAPAGGPYGTGTINFVPTVLSFTALTDSVTFSISNESRTGIMGVDNVSLAAAGAVPEPASWAMMIGGLGMIGWTMRRRVRRVAIA